METKPSSLIPLDEISQEFPYGLRFDYRDDRLRASLKRRGMLFPLLLSRGRQQDPWTVVSGHKRFVAAVDLGLKDAPAFLLEEALSPRDLFILSLYSNQGQSFADLDRMMILSKAGKDFSIQELKEEIWPFLGISAHQAEECKQISGLTGQIHLLAHQKKLPFHGAGSLSRFTKAEQIFLAENLFQDMHLTSNQLMQVSEWLKDLQKSKKMEISKILAEENLSKILYHSKMDPRTRGERFFEALRSERFPRLSQKEKEFQKLKAKLEDSKEVKLQRPEGFEAQGLILRTHLKKKGIAKIVHYLEDHQAILEDFLEA